MANFQKIKTIAAEKNIALGDIAKQLVITPTAMSTIIRENATYTRTIEKIAQILGVKVGVFFDDDEPVANGVTAADQSDLKSIITQKDAIIAQKDEIIAQKDAIIKILTNSRH